MSVHALYAALRDTALDCVAENSRQASLLFNDSVECDSLAEHVIALRRHGVPEHRVQAMLTLTRGLIMSNHAEGNGGREMVAAHDDLASTAHAASRPRVGTRPPTVKQLAALVREAQDADALPALLAEYPRARLITRSLLHELGVGRARDLMAAIGAFSGDPLRNSSLLVPGLSSKPEPESEANAA